MARAAKTDRVPKTRAGGQWSECAFFAFIRSGLRLLSRRWPARADAYLRVRKPYSGPNKRAKWMYRCECCGAWKMRKEVEADHIEPCGKLSSFDDVGPFLERLLCEADGIRILCNTCHALKTSKSRTKED